MSSTKSQKINTQISNSENYVPSERVIYSEPKESKIKDKKSNQTLTTYRFSISSSNEDGTVGELLFLYERLFCFGVSPNKNDQGQITGFSMPLCMWDKENPTEEQKKSTSVLEEIEEFSKQHLLKNSLKIGKPKLKYDQLEGLGSQLYWKKDPETKEEIKTIGPTLYPKLITNKSNKILSLLYDTDGNDIDPFSLFDPETEKGRFCYVKAVVKVESIFVGAQIKLQYKIREAEVEPLEMKIKSIIRPTRQRPVIEAKLEEVKSSPKKQESSDLEPSDDEGSLNEAKKSSPEKSPKVEEIKKKIVRKVIKKPVQ